MVFKYNNHYVVMVNKAYLTFNETPSPGQTYQDCSNITSKEELNKMFPKRISSLNDIKFLYALEADDHTVKIGVTNNIHRRRNQISCVSGKKFINEFTTDLCYNAYDVEKILKKTLKEYNLSGEWFSLDYESIKKIIIKLFAEYAQI